MIRTGKNTGTVNLEARVEYDPKNNNLYLTTRYYPLDYFGIYGDKMWHHKLNVDRQERGNELLNQVFFNTWRAYDSILLNVQVLGEGSHEIPMIYKIVSNKEKEESIIPIKITFNITDDDLVKIQNKQVPENQK